MMFKGEMSRRAVLAQAARLAVAAPLLTLLGCDEFDSSSDRVSFWGVTMGTTYRVAITGGLDLPKHDRLQQMVETVLETINGQMSTYRAASELSKFNGVGQASWFDVSPQIAGVVATALEISRLSDGAFDATIGPLVNLWGFGPYKQTARAPSQDQITSALENTGHHHLHVNSLQTAIRKRRPDLHVDLSGIGKGFAVDQVAEVLAGAGAKNFLVDIGGDMIVRRHSPAQAPWRIGIEQPTTTVGNIRRVINIGDGAVATSGNYRNFFEAGGSRFSHIIDPRSGAPVKHNLASVTVIAPSTEEADGWSTALMVLGADDGFELAKKLGLSAFFITRTGNRLVDRSTSDFQRFLVH
jgi:thiamine biosynthesis lipoprotein